MVRVILSRRHFLATTSGVIGGCMGFGSDQSTPTPSPDNPAIGDVTQKGNLSLRSPAFDDGEEIPREYGRDQRNVNPPLVISKVPSDAASLTLIMDDPDAVEPAGEVWLHWLVWNVPPTRNEIPEGWDPQLAVVGTNDFGETGYGGPDPPEGVHTYRFKLFALGTKLDVPTSAGKRTIGEAMTDHVLAQTQLEGTYQS